MKHWFVWILFFVLSPLLLAGEYSSDWKAFVTEIDKGYPFFELKEIKKDWSKEKIALGKRADKCKADDEFLLVVADTLKFLRDAHAGFKETRMPLPEAKPEYCLPLALMPTEKNGVVVMSVSRSVTAEGLKPGIVISQIDGKPAREFLEKQAEKSWKEGGSFSSRQRARMFVYRLPFRSTEIREHTLTCVREGKDEKITIKNGEKVSGWVHTYNMPQELKGGGGSCFYTRLPSGTGYLYLRRIQGEKTTRGVEAALKEIRDTKGWIVDLRGNGGGGYGQDLVDAFGKMPKPVAVIIDEGCISAGETLARDLKGTLDARLFGAKTAGSSSAKRVWEFPSGVASVILSTRSRGGVEGKPIEYNGISLDVPVEAVPAEVLEGKNSEILRADEFLRVDK